MNIVNAGDKYIVYGEEIKTYKTLPVGTYKVQFNKMTGFYLIHYNDPVVNEKIYGSYVKKIPKVMNSFKNFNRNMGIILSGPKGVGKSVFAKLLAKAGRENNLPLIIIDSYFSEIETFISSIEQECIVLFDEFEKIFKIDKENDFNPQENLLSLFDGVDSGKKLYIITCNEIQKLSSYLINRPGRFHYHFTMTPPSEEEIREYMEDNLNEDAYQYIDKLVSLSSVSAFTYDILRAIVFDLNQGYDLNETLMDLNIEREQYVDLTIKIIFTNGFIAYAEDSFSLDMSNNNLNSIWCGFGKNTIPKEFKRSCSAVNIRFSTQSVTFNEKGYYLDSSDVDLLWDSDFNYIDETDETKQFKKNFEIAKIILEKAKPKYGHSNFAYKYLI